MTIDILWTTILDPRCRSLKHLSAPEREASKETLIDKCCKCFKKPNRSPNQYPSMMKTIHSFDIFDSPVKNYTARREGDEDEETKENELLHKSAVREVENYLDHSMRVSPEVSSLD